MEPLPQEERDVAQLEPKDLVVRQRVVRPEPYCCLPRQPLVRRALARLEAPRLLDRLEAPRVTEEEHLAELVRSVPPELE